MYRHIGAAYANVSFPQKVAITNSYGLIYHTTTHVASKVSFYVLQEKAKGQSIVLLYFMVKQVSQAVQFNTSFNPIVEKAAEFK